MRQIALAGCCFAALASAGQQGTEGQTSPRLRLEQAIDGRLAKECGAVVHAPEVTLAPRPTFRERVLLGAGDPKQMSRRQLELLGLDLEIASLRDAGLLLELNHRPAEDRRTLLPRLWTKWEGLRGSALRDEYYTVLARALSFRLEEGRRKKPEDQSFAERVLLDAGEPGRLSRQAIDDLYREYRRAQLRDEGFTVEAATTSASTARRKTLREKWMALRGAALEDEYYAAITNALESHEKAASRKAATQRTLAEAVATEAKPSGGLSRNDLDDLLPLFQIAVRCDESKRGARPRRDIR